MAYIYKKTVGGKSYYYLRISKRMDGKLVTKDVAYLGTSASDVEKKLNNLPKFKNEIRKSYKTIKKFIQSSYYLDKVIKNKIKHDDYLDKTLLEQIEAIKLHFNERFLKQDSLTIKDIYKQFLIEFAFNTTSLEGNTITLKEAERLLSEDILPNNKTSREVYDLQNTEKTFFWLLDNMYKFTDNLIITVHDMLLNNIDERKGYRTHDIRVFRSKFDASPVEYVKTDMNVLMKLLDKQKRKLHPLVFACIFHHKMEKIHPFSDGNGRTGRVLLNYWLLKEGYPPLIISKNKRNKYLDMLNFADKSDLTDVDRKYYSKLSNYVAEELIESYWKIFNV